VVPYVAASGYNNNSVLGDIAIVGTPGENLVVGANGSHAGLRFINSTDTTTTVGNFYLIDNSFKFGYDTGAGGTVNQLTNKSTAVTLNAPTGLITTANSVLNANTTTTFTLTNTVISNTDIILLQHVSGGTNGSYTLNAFPGAGSAVISIRNITGGNLTQQPVIRFVVIRSVNS
jgi:hypothetical protein